MARQAKSDDVAVRCIYSRSHISISKREVKHGAFEPPTNNPSELSVNIKTNLSDEQIWQRCQPRNGSQVKARAELRVGTITDISHKDASGNTQKLQVIIDNHPHKGHANITNLPSSWEMEEMRAVAAELARESKLILR